MYYTLFTMHYAMNTSTKQNILEYIEQHDVVTVKEVTQYFGLNPTIIHRHLKDLLEQEKIIKLGKAPKVVYKANRTEKYFEEGSLSYTEKQFLERYYYAYDSDGNVLQGYEGFINRCIQRHVDVKNQLNLYQAIITHIESLKDSQGMIDGKNMLSVKLGDIRIDRLHFIDAYQVGHFGRSKLGSLTFYAKQSQNKELIKKVVHIVKPAVYAYLTKYNIDGICFIPPSIRRGVQFMTELKKQLAIDLPELKLQKLFPSSVVIPQKSLKTMEQRIKNAENTIFVTSWQSPVKNLLLIDDFMGSGATLNTAARKIKEHKLAKKVQAISLLGNIDTQYEVINEI